MDVVIRTSIVVGSTARIGFVRAIVHDAKAVSGTIQVFTELVNDLVHTSQANGMVDVETVAKPKEPNDVVDDVSHPITGIHRDISVKGVVTVRDLISSSITKLRTELIEPRGTELVNRTRAADNHTFNVIDRTVTIATELVSDLDHTVASERIQPSSELGS